MLNLHRCSGFKKISKESTFLEGDFDGPLEGAARDRTREPCS